MGMTLLDWKNSYNSRKIRAVAFECDLNIEPKEVNPMAGECKTPEHMAMNPNGKVPVLKDGNFSLWESNAIMCYVAAKDPNHRLLPVNPTERAKVDQWLFWQTAHLSPSLGKLAYEYVWKARLGQGGPDEAAITAAMPEIERYLKVLDTTLAKSKWVAGSDLTVADFACAAAFMTRDSIKLNLTPYSHVTTWLNAVESRPSWKNAAW
jgi:glutathione S-transferase